MFILIYFILSIKKRDVQGFNKFIENIELIYSSMVRRKSTWYIPNGSIKSRSNIIIVSRKWVDMWSRCK